MKKYSMIFVLLAVLICLAPLATAQQISNQLPWKTSVPFAFHVGGETLPAGDYLVRWSLGGAIQISSADRQHVAMLLAGPRSDSKRMQRTNWLSFNRYGSSAFLSGIYFAGAADRVDVGKTRLEVELAKAERRTQETIMAQGTDAGSSQVAGSGGAN